MGTVVIKWYVAEEAGCSEIVANPPRFLRRKKLLFRSSFVLPSEIRFTLQTLRRNVFNSFGCDNQHSKAVTGSQCW